MINAKRLIFHRSLFTFRKTYKEKQDYIIGSILEKEITVQGNPYVFRSLKDELVRFVNIYGTPIQDDDEEMMIWVLEMILAMRTKEKSKVLPLNK